MRKQEKKMSDSLSDLVDLYLPFMRDVAACEKSLHELGVMWRVVEAVAKANCPRDASAILPTISETRQGFRKLEQDLVSGLVRQKVDNVLHDIGTRAHYVIDIIVRNLYERTADIGFLATDADLCEFAAGIQPDRAQAVARMAAYRSKYTVYDDIVILGLDGTVMAHVDESGPGIAGDAALIEATLASDSYVETFRPSPLCPSKRNALIYSKALAHPSTGAPAGILCLCFNFDEEMAGIFRTYRDTQSRFNLLLVNADGRAIASADEHWVPVGTTIPPIGEDGMRPVAFGGRYYLARTFAAAGYQNYMGPPGWRGVAMIPIDVAFMTEESLDGAVDADDRGVLAHASKFSPPLHEIMLAVDTIRRVVWNGQAMAAGKDRNDGGLRNVLEQINETGAHSQQVFSRSIDDLYRTVVRTRMNDAELTARLLVDLVDRNLYERSDDCRWWAMTPQLRRILADGNPDTAALATMRRILDYINGLYTVYTRLFVYDASGTILAGTDLLGSGLRIEGEQVPEEILERVLALKSEQDYYVPPFRAPSFGGKPTYVYHAAIRDPDDPARVVGGIGIVFNAETELHNMLTGALDGRPDTDAWLVDRDGTVIASTDSRYPVGSRLPIAELPAGMANGKSGAAISIHDGDYAVLGHAVSCGYREFKNGDGYVDDIIAVVASRIGAAGAEQPAVMPLDTVTGDERARGSEEFAVFASHGNCFAIPARDVIEALPASAVSGLSMGASAERVGVIALRSTERGERFVWVFDFGLLAARRPNVRNGTGQVVIVRTSGVEFGLLVDDVLSIASFSNESISSTPVGGETGVNVVDRIIRVSRDVLVQVVNAQQLLVRLDAKNVPEEEQQFEEPGALVPMSGLRPSVQLPRYEEPARKVA
jgi:chemotaxis signal transduction protein